MEKVLNFCETWIRSEGTYCGRTFDRKCVLNLQNELSLPKLPLFDALNTSDAQYSKSPTVGIIVGSGLFIVMLLTVILVLLYVKRIQGQFAVTISRLTGSRRSESNVTLISRLSIGRNRRGTDCVTIKLDDDCVINNSETMLTSEKDQQIRPENSVEETNETVFEKDNIPV